MSAPMTLVVMPDECQSIPITAPNDWNQNGLASRLSSSSRPYSCTIAWQITAPSRAIRSLSHFGTRPPCSGKSALPARLAMRMSPFRAMIARNKQETNPQRQADPQEGGARRKAPDTVQSPLLP